METARPASDLGLFGPDSVTWRVNLSPAMIVSAGAAVLLEMLHPKVMRMIDQASTFRTHPDVRVRLTTEYTNTITYGDTTQAETAGETLRYIHGMRKASDPETGQEYGADEPDLLLWVHSAQHWCTLRALDRYGPKLSPQEKDRFLTEQKIAARLVGIDPSRAPGSVAELDAYMEGMRGRLAFVAETAWMRDMIVPPGFSLKPQSVLRKLVGNACLDLLTHEMRVLYGFHSWPASRHWLVSRLTKLLLDLAGAKVTFAKALPAIRSQIQAHAFGRRAVQENADRRARKDVGGPSSGVPGP